MNKICTSIEQTKKLIEIGIDVNTADLTVIDLPIQNGDRFKFINNKLPGDIFPSITDGKSEKIPAWSLTALLGLIPDKISINNESYYLSFTKKSVEFRGPITWDGQKTKSFEMDNIIDAAFEMIVWLKENGKI